MAVPLCDGEKRDCLLCACEYSLLSVRSRLCLWDCSVVAVGCLCVGALGRLLLVE